MSMKTDNRKQALLASTTKSFIACLIAFLLLATSLTAQDPFDDFLEAYEKYGGGKYMINEEIIQSQHVLQAAYLAKKWGAPENAIIGLLFHDVGQVIDADNVGNLPYLHASHDEVGGRWLAENGFPMQVVDWVRYHTLTKVVLCMEDPSYYSHLSDASKESYHIQRDKYMNEEGQVSLHAFMEHPNRQDFMCQRKCDDMAKIVNFETPENFEDYRAMAQRVIGGSGAPATDAHWRETVDDMHAWMCQDRAAFEQSVRDGLTIPNK